MCNYSVWLYFFSLIFSFYRTTGKQYSILQYNVQQASQPSSPNFGHINSKPSQHISKCGHDTSKRGHPSPRTKLGHPSSKLGHLSSKRIATPTPKLATSSPNLTTKSLNCVTISLNKFTKNNWNNHCRCMVNMVLKNGVRNYVLYGLYFYYFSALPTLKIKSGFSAS